MPPNMVLSPSPVLSLILTLWVPMGMAQSILGYHWMFKGCPYLVVLDLQIPVQWNPFFFIYIKPVEASFPQNPNFCLGITFPDIHIPISNVLDPKCHLS